MRRPARLLAGLALMTTTAATAQFDPGSLKGAPGQPPGDVLVLGTPHLSGLPEAFRPAALAPLLDRLAAWRPRAIAIEALSGVQCDALRRHPARWADTVKTYCWDTAPARAATGLDVPAATAEAETLLARWPAAPSPAERRRLAALFLAGGEGASALVQWLRLPAAERRAGDGLDAALVQRLEMLRERRNEDYLIAAALAARLGLERVYPMDDHSSDRPFTDEAAAEAAIGKAWDNPVNARRLAQYKAVDAGSGSGDGVLAMYRLYNAADQGRLAYDSDFGAALREPSPGGYGRAYLASWEVRNLRMAGNIREAMAERPGARMLVIVGASHKPYLEAYLRPMHDVAVVDAEAVLR